MTSTPSITTWISSFRPLADQEGSALLFSGDTVILASDPASKIETNSWDDLKACQSGFHVGYLGYEMGSKSDPDWKIEMHPSPFPGACFYVPQKIERMQRTPHEVPYQDPLHLLSRSDTKQSYLKKTWVNRSSFLSACQQKQCRILSLVTRNY